jgi:hypothetical protein
MMQPIRLRQHPSVRVRNGWRKTADGAANEA